MNIVNASEIAALSDDDASDFLLKLVYEYLDNITLNQMNAAQRTLYLAIRLEDICQADALPSLAEEPALLAALPEMQQALETLGLPETAAAIAELREMLRADGIAIPDWDWFSAPERKERTAALDRRISSYPDGAAMPRYIAYMREHAAQLPEHMQENEFGTK